MLTGKMRYRTNWRGKVILQVEVGGRWANTWRDATLADLPMNKPSSLIGLPYSPDDERFVKFLDSQWRAGRRAGWNECYRHHFEKRMGS